VTLQFCEPKKISGEPLQGEFGDVCKALFTLRFNRSQQSLPNQRNFITAFGYVAVAARSDGASLQQLTPSHFDTALRWIGEAFAESTTYNLAKALKEIAAHLDENGLCRVRLDYKPRMSRPENVNTMENRSLDDPAIDEPVRPDQLADESIYKLLGALFQRVPSNSKDRIYVLILTLLACTGRRISEITRLPNQSVEVNRQGAASIRYFPRKSSQGDAFTPKKRLWLPSATKDIVQDAIEEAQSICERERVVAANMRQAGGADLSLIAGDAPDKRYYKNDLAERGLSKQLLSSHGWLGANGFAYKSERLAKNRSVVLYTTRDGVIAYCQARFQRWMIQSLETESNGDRLYPEHLLFLQFHYLAGKTRAEFLAEPISHAMVGKWIERTLPMLAEEYAPEVAAEISLTSHAFRHTMNHLLDQGGLSELIQTSWFGRANPRDTRAYQHTSREKRIAAVMEDLRNGQAGGNLAADLEYIPVDRREAYLAARVGAVHDVGTGICIHDFSQTPCPNHLQCQADCDDYVWAKNDGGRLEEIKRVWANTKLARDAAVEKAESERPKYSADWIAHEDTKLATLETQLAANGVENPDLDSILAELGVENE
jgi:integrase